ncbi:MAG: hypothetical protein ABIA74_03185 [bacterium]
MKYLKILFILVLNFNLGALNVELKNSFDEIKKKKEISFWVELEATENIIKNHKISVEPESLFIQSFRNNKKVYNCSFNLNFKLDFLEDKLDPNTIFIFQTLIFDEDKNTIFAKTLSISLADKLIQEIKIQNSKLKRFAENKFPFKNKLFNLLLAKKEFYQNTELKDNIKKMRSKIYSFAKTVPNLFLMILLAFLLFWVGARIFKRIDLFAARKAFIKEFMLFILFFSFLGFVFYLKDIYLNKVLLFFIACCFLIVSSYYLMNFSGKSLIKLILGLSFGFFVLPFFLKALILNFL